MLLIHIHCAETIQLIAHMKSMFFSIKICSFRKIFVWIQCLHMIFACFPIPEDRSQSICGHIRGNNHRSNTNSTRPSLGRQHTGEFWKWWRHRHQILIHCFNLRLRLSRPEFAGLRMYNAQDGHLPMGEKFARWKRRGSGKQRQQSLW